MKRDLARTEAAKRASTAELAKITRERPLIEMDCLPFRKNDRQRSNV
ncbi:MAG: hypothetical protein V1492_04510 [Candidatus Micrarchaeota archaeon]